MSGMGGRGVEIGNRERGGTPRSPRWGYSVASTEPGRSYRGRGEEEGREKRRSWGTWTVKEEKGSTGWERMAKECRRVEEAGLIFRARWGQGDFSPQSPDSLRNSLL